MGANLGRVVQSCTPPTWLGLKNLLNKAYLKNFSALVYLLFGFYDVLIAKNNEKQ